MVPFQISLQLLDGPHHRKALLLYPFMDFISSMPSKEEQANLLKSVEEIFQIIRALVNDEVSATDTSAVIDIQHMVVQAMNYLLLVEELTLLKIFTLKKENSVCYNNATHFMEKSVVEGEEQLQICLDDAINIIYNNSQLVRSTVGEAINQGDGFLVTLNNCSQKPGLQLISCYKKVIATDVFPLKLILVDALNIHKSVHFESILVKQKSIECVDNVLKKQKEKIEQILNDALKTCT
ncbi:hypothetical protein RI129_010542 [Pyrocoelia pectoralis]|uniref:Uncharacterized protein n=1 Tax=Pyrocoelia pectoralis TaxID=417401 RepID=A0AAN7V6E4_9COLE